ncbi:MAG: ParB/RepB/Spo0J family partition protein [Nocardioidaceae bacterium]
MTTHKRGLGRGLGSLIPNTPARPSPSTVPATAPSTAEGGPAGPDDPDGAGATEGQVEGAHPHGDHRATDTDAAGPEHTSGTGDGDMTEMAPVAGAYFTEVPVRAISPNPRQPRTVFDEDAMAELIHSVREVGLLQPIVVRPLADEAFELIVGERRWRACQQAGLDTIPAIVRETSDDELLRDALLENLHRAELNPLEEAAAYQQLLEDFGCTHDQLAERLGRSRPQITNMLRLLRLSPPVQRRVAAGVVSAGHARALLAIDDADRQEALAARVVAEGISVRALEELVAVPASDNDTGTGNGTARRRSATVRAPGLDDIADRLSERFETRCKVDLGKNKGKITVEFASLDDLQRILTVMDPHSSSPAETDLST